MDLLHELRPQLRPVFLRSIDEGTGRVFVKQNNSLRDPVLPFRVVCPLDSVQTSHHADLTLTPRPLPPASTDLHQVDEVKLLPPVLSDGGIDVPGELVVDSRGEAIFPDGAEHRLPPSTEMHYGVEGGGEGRRKREGTLPLYPHLPDVPLPTAPAMLPEDLHDQQKLSTCQRIV